jgi:Ca-activated chloride channel family protein
MRASVRLEHELLAVEHDHTVACMLELTTPPAPVAADRRPLALALVIDRSGSMTGGKLDVTRRCARFLVEHLAEDDQLAVITFDDQVDVATPLVPVGPNRPALHAGIASIVAGGQTNLSGGWLKGVEALSALDDGTHTRRVLLLTDGMANVGITDDLQLAKMARASAGDGIGSTTIGFGAGFSEDLLTAMADAGGGGAHFAESPDAAPAIFAEEFTDLLSLVAQNVSATISPAWDQVRLLEIMNDFPQVQQADASVQVQIGDAYGDETRRLVFQLHVPALATLGPAKVADVVIRYVSVGEQIAMHEVTVPVVVNAVSADDAAAAVPDAQVTEEVVVLASARAQERARELAMQGDIEAASSLLRSAAGDLRRVAPHSARADELLGQAALTEEHLASMDGFDGLSAKRMKFDARARQQGRPRREP